MRLVFLGSTTHLLFGVTRTFVVWNVDKDLWYIWVPNPFFRTRNWPTDVFRLLGYYTHVTLRHRLRLGPRLRPYLGIPPRPGLHHPLIGRNMYTLSEWKCVKENWRKIVSKSLMVIRLLMEFSMTSLWWKFLVWVLIIEMKDGGGSIRRRRRSEDLLDGPKGMWEWRTRVGVT